MGKYQQKQQEQAAAAAAKVQAEQSETVVESTEETAAPTEEQVTEMTETTEALQSEMDEAEAQAAADAKAAAEAARVAEEAAALEAAKVKQPPVQEPAPVVASKFSYSAVAGTHIDFLRQYSVEMDPSQPVNTERTRRNQRTLLRTLKAAIALPKAEDMIAVLDEFRKLVTEHRKKAFSEMYIFRDLQSVELSQEECLQFTYLIQTFLVMSDEDSRKSLNKQVDLKLVTKWILDEQVRTRFLAYCDRASK